jgi:Zn-dependent protease with chaperone function
MPVSILLESGGSDVGLSGAVSVGLALVVLPFAAAFATTLVAARLALASGTQGEHWSARARRLSPALGVAMVSTWIAAGGSGALASRMVVLFPRPPIVSFLAAVSFALLGGWSASWVLFRRLAHQPVGWRTYVRDQAALLAIVMPQAAILLAVVATFGAAPLVRTPVIVAAVAAWVAISLGGSFSIARLLRRIHPSSPKLADAVARAAARVGRSPRSCVEVELPFANAFANPVTQRLFFTRRAVAALADDELEAVAAHELGHLSEPRSVVWARVAASLALLPILFLPSLIGGLGWLGGLAVVYGAMLAVTIPMRRLQRRMEERADRVADCGAERSPALARGLERAYRMNLTPAVGPRQGTHPHLYDRMIAAGVEPDFPRPARPSRFRIALGMGAATACLACFSLLHLSPANSLAAVISDPVARSRAAIVITGGTRNELFDLALLYGPDRPGEALAVAEFLAEERPRDPDCLALHAWTLALNGRCFDSAGVLARATTIPAREDEPATWMEMASIALEECAAP